MNHCYRLVWSQVHSAWVVVTEIARSRGKTKSSKANSSKTVAAASFLLALSSVAVAAPPAVNALPTGGSVTAGSATISSAGSTMNINQATQRAAYSFSTFDIGAAATVNVNQNNSASVGLFHVNSSSPSQIYGHLNATGHIFLLNPAGTYFAPGSQVNVGGLVASTMHMNDADFMAGNYSLSNPGGGLIEALGNINAGSVAMVGNNISNSGNIVATTVSLVSGNTVAIDLTGNNLIRARVVDPALSASIANSGNIQAATVTLNAGQAKDALNRMVNNSGTIRAVGLVNEGGEISLIGNSIVQSGKLDASGNVGGEITVAANDITMHGANLNASGDNGGGTILIGGDWQGKNAAITNAQNVFIDANTVIKADALISGNGGKVVVWSDDTTQFFGNISARGGSIFGNGGKMEVSGKQNLAFGGFANAGAAHGKSGSLLLDPKSINISTGGLDPATGQTYSNSYSSNFIIAPTAITAITNTGTAVTLQANDDITVNSAITTSAGGNGGDLTLAAGRSILLNANITTDNGDLNLVANDTLANGVVDAERDPGTAVITMAAGTSINAGSGYVTVYLANGAGRTNTAAGDITLENITSGTLLVVNNGSGSNIVANGAINTTNFELDGGNWQQIAGTLPTFNATNFLITSGTFTRAKSGDGLSAATAYAIADVYGLQGIDSTANLGKFYKLANNIDVSSAAGWNGGLGFDPIGGNCGCSQFNGHFDGNNKTLSNLTINHPGSAGTDDYIGLFGSVAGGATISNLVLSGGSVTGNHNTGALAGEQYGTVTNVSSSVTVNGHGNSVGGLVGLNGGTVNNSSASGDVTGTATSTGGLVGWVISGSITGSHATGNVTGQAHTGGLVGQSDGNISGSYATTGDVTGTYRTGGLVGWNNNTANISNSYATGNVTSTGNNTGGLAGDSWYGTISNSYATGDVTGVLSVGGLVGDSWSDITNSYASGDVSGNGRVGGLVGYSYRSGALITGSHATGDVSGSSDVGGLVGKLSGDQISSSFATGGVTGTGSGVGGLVGFTQGGSTIDTSFATGDVTGGDLVGGLVGWNYGAVGDSFAIGNVSGNNNVGGLVGVNDSGGSIDNSYSIGAVTGSTFVGGFVGDSISAVNNSFWDIDTSGLTTSAGGTGLTTAEMQTASTFTAASWNGTTIWTLADGAYPVLQGLPNPYFSSSDGLSDKQVVDNITSSILDQLNNNANNKNKKNSANQSNSDTGTAIQVALVSDGGIEEIVTLNVPKGKVLTCQ